ncbi:MAG: hypothetical protein U0Q18_32330 [Bryobacteraceae bacterium]
MTSVEPGSGKVGDVLSIQGVNLGPDFIAALYLTDGTTDVKVPILEQTATLVRFRIPPEAKPGRVALMILTKEKVPRLIEEPVKITVESENPTTTASFSSGAIQQLVTVLGRRLECHV